MATFMLVHGAFHGGWCWKKVLPLLRAGGHEVFTPTLTGLGERAHLLTPTTNLQTHVQDVTAVLEYENLSRVVLVGHSYGGMVITAVAERVPERLRHLVCLDAFVLGDGQALFDLITPEGRARHHDMARTSEDAWRIPPFSLEDLGVTAADDVKWMRPRLGPQPLQAFVQPVHLTNRTARALPRTLISCTVEQLPGHAALARRVRAEPGWRYREIATGHDAMITAPQAVAALLMELT
jgi:pimeloyl-ACP methyl ester carboxylesterase